MNAISIEPTAQDQNPTVHNGEGHTMSLGSRLNALRAGVLGANDGVASVAGIVFGVAGATKEPGALVIAGLAGLVAGALAMAGGEYVSVASQKDTEIAVLAKERRELAEFPEAELAELAGLYQAKGLSAELAHQVAVELTAHDALGAHAEAELGIDPDEHANPYVAAVTSMIAFTLGGLIPLLAMLLSPMAVRLPVSIAAVLVALGLTGAVGGHLGGAHPVRPIIRNIVVGAASMALTYGIGTLVGTQI